MMTMRILRVRKCERRFHYFGFQTKEEVKRFVHREMGVFVAQRKIISMKMFDNFTNFNQGGIGIEVWNVDILNNKQKTS